MPNKPPANKTTANGPASDEASGATSRATSDADTDTAAPAAVAEPKPVVTSVPASSKARWTLTSIAGVGLLGLGLLLLGLLGGVLIGQQLGLSTAQAHGPSAHITIEHQQSGQRERLPERVRERLQERFRDVRDRREAPSPQAPNQQAPNQPAPSTPTPGNNG